jgi:hypothetical protein
MPCGREWLAVTNDKEGERVTKESNQDRVIKKMSELKQHPDVRDSGLQDAEILALQLYTGVHHPVNVHLWRSYKFCTTCCAQTHETRMY